MKFILVLTLCVAGAIAHCDKAPFIKAAWNQVKHNEVDILYNVFKDYPEIQAKFPQFAGKDLEQIKNGSEFAVHATRIISFMSEIISLVGNPAYQSSINSLLEKMAHDHKARGVTKELFEKFHTSFMAYLKAHTTWDEQTENAWKIVGDEHHAIVYSILE